MPDNNAVVGIYNTHTEAEAAVKELQRSGFDMKKLSIVGKDYHTEEHVIGYYNAGDRMMFWGKLSWIIGALENAAVVGGFSALSAGLLSIGIPKNSVLDYEEAVKASKFLVIAHGTTDEVGKAKSVLETSGATRVGTHEAHLPTDEKPTKKNRYL